MEEDIEEEVKGMVENKKEGWRREGKVIFWRERAYVPDFATLREQIVRDHHDHELAGHPGYTKTHEPLISKSMYLDVNNARSPKQTDKENEICYTQMRFPNAHGILSAWILQGPYQFRKDMTEYWWWWTDSQKWHAIFQ